jgi:hypothetical protein
MWSDLVPVVVQVLAVVLPAVGTLVLALISRATAKVQAARAAATAVEFSPLAQRGLLSSEQKLALAVDQIRSSAPLLARMSEAEAERAIEAVLPSVVRLSDPSQLKPSNIDKHPKT